ncbi:anhydro-N-acetylmuramic acid kinase [bacterium]|nr:MAG: anhydro-N-acetylmuramic acid kinase [bacterium]
MGQQKPSNWRLMRILGMMAGTSLDGIDAALCEIEGSGADLKARVVAFECLPYEPTLRERLLKACSNVADVREVARLNVEVGEAFAATALHVFELHGRAEIIASHGQTIAHLPDVKATLQIGEGAVLAERTGATVVCNFRPRDVAAGGQGAPLVPYADWVLLRHATKNRVVLNIGGIANVSILPANCTLDDVRAWDTGPGNMLIDAAMGRYFGLSFDADGEFASGEVLDSLLEEVLQHPYLQRRPPKTAGREDFGSEFLEQFALRADVLANSDISPEDVNWNAHDLLATLTRLTVRSIAESIHRFSGFERGDYELIVGGGGTHNSTLMRMLAEEVAPSAVLRHEDVGLSSDAKEALAFAILGSETLRGVATSVPGATGAPAARVLGQIVPGDNFRQLMA